MRRTFQSFVLSICKFKPLMHLVQAKHELSVNFEKQRKQNSQYLANAQKKNVIMHTREGRGARDRWGVWTKLRFYFLNVLTRCLQIWKLVHYNVLKSLLWADNNIAVKSSAYVQAPLSNLILIGAILNNIHEVVICFLLVFFSQMTQEDLLSLDILKLPWHSNT